MSKSISVILTKFDNGYNADIVCADSSSIMTGYSTTRIFNRAFKAYKKGEQFVATFTMGPRGRRKFISGALFTGSSYPAHFGFFPITVPVVPTYSKKGTVKVAQQAAAPMKTYQKPAKVEANPLDGYYISPETKMVFSTAHGMSLDNPQKAVKLIMVGPSGFGKTTMPKLLAKVTGRNFLRMNCASIRDSEEWFGYREARNGTTVFVPSQFSEAIQAGNLVLVLDEFNRVESWLHNTLYPLLDDDGCTTIHDQKISVGPNVIICATINTGYKYTGTFELDEALSRRFDFFLEVGPMPHAQEVEVLKKQTGLDVEQANHLVKMANTLRGENISCSTATTLEMAKMIVGGMLIREALEFSIIRRISQDEAGGGLRKQAIDLVNTRHGPFAVRTMPNDIFGTVAKDEVPTTLLVEIKEKMEVTLLVKTGEIFRYLQFMEMLKSLTVIGLETSIVRYSKKMADLLQDGKSVTLELDVKSDMKHLTSKFEGFGLVVSYKVVEL